MMAQRSVGMCGVSANRNDAHYVELLFYLGLLVAHVNMQKQTKRASLLLVNNSSKGGFDINMEEQNHAPTVRLM
jgi:hypothetical protein